MDLTSQRFNYDIVIILIVITGIGFVKGQIKRGITLWPSSKIGSSGQMVFVFSLCTTLLWGTTSPSFIRFWWSANAKTLTSYRMGMPGLINHGKPLGCCEWSKDGYLTKERQSECCTLMLRDGEVLLCQDLLNEDFRRSYTLFQSLAFYRVKNIYLEKKNKTQKTKIN